MAARDRPRGAKRQGSDSAAMSTISGSCPLNSEGGPRSTGSGTPNCVPNEQAAIAEHRSMVSRNSSIFRSASEMPRAVVRILMTSDDTRSAVSGGHTGGSNKTPTQTSCRRRDVPRIRLEARSLVGHLISGAETRRGPSHHFTSSLGSQDGSSRGAVTP